MRRNLDSSPRREGSVLTLTGEEDRAGVNVLSMDEQAHCALIEAGQFTFDNVEPNIDLMDCIILGGNKALFSLYPVRKIE